MKYSLMSLMVDDMLKHIKTGFILKSILEGMGVTEVPEDADAAYAMLQERGVPMYNGTATFEDLVKFTKENGFDGLDMMSFQMEIPGKEMGAILKKYGVVLSAVNVVCPVNLAVNEEMYQGMMAGCFHSIDESIDAGALKIMFVPAGYDLAPGQTREDCYELIVRSFKEILAYCQQKGIPVSTETLESTAIPLCSIGELDRLFAAVPGMLYNHDSGNPLVDNEDPMAMYRRYKDKVINVHFKDLGFAENAAKNYKRMSGDVISLVPLGTGLVDFKAHLKALKEDGYDGFITLEGGIPAEDKWGEAVAALKYFRALEAEC